MPFVTSADGTRIAYEQSGSGPALILVDGAMCYRDSGPMRPLAKALADRFTVIAYDRRGRGESGDTQPYATDREIEDLEALIAGPGGGSVRLYGASSGGALALETASRNPARVHGLVIYEMPIIVDASRDPLTDAWLAGLDAEIAAGRNGAAVSRFMKFVGVPGLGILMMRLMMGKVWRKLEAIAPTLPYDLALVGPLQRGQGLPAGRWDLAMPALIADGGKSPQWMRNGQRALATVLAATYRTLDGETHMVNAGAQAPMIRAFFEGA